MHSAIRGIFIAVGLALAASAGHAQETLTTIRLISAPTAFEPIYIARDKGFFEKHGLKVEILPGGVPDAMMPQLINGQVEIALTAGITVLNAVTRGLPVKLILGNMKSSIDHPPTAAIFVPPGSDITSVEDLAGRRIAMPGLHGMPHLAVIVSAKAKGLDPASISFVEVPLPAMATAAKNGTVDAIYSVDPFSSAAISEGFEFIEASGQVYMDGVPAVAFAASNDYIRDKPEILAAFRAAMTEAFEYATANPEAIRQVDRDYTRLAGDFIDTRILPQFDGRIDVEALELMGREMVEAGWLQSSPDIDDVVDENAPRL